ncbi:beta-lactamase/transpeptidase-like protein [Aaosphaeria arxii CBS 175.79]|uniref:Beta-lactamase/transpeptidase-like protein n=1 Tax=Aaosphaeria arxii CBS 175.79 TaxID=1450172 RepID=A0A6A5Y5J1_9PLEO|nr:beta-lactamase/transpeptidase-like protein [Aaosphaeria arxii CBS 175.79]KAF2019814.1 beta-lactamase/transpeptidase-like protein [Aaosphaeria arxii CBS 175.79]
MAAFTSEFDEQVEELMKEFHVPGISIAIVKKDDIQAKGYGYAKLSSDDKVTADTLFDCASTSKSFTASAVALLVQDDEKFPDVHWDTPVSKLLPDDFVLADPMYTEHVTIEDILSHRSGMPRHDESYFSYRGANPDTPKSITRNLRNLPLSRPLRVEHQYCNIMYTAASYLVETLSGQSYAEFLKTRFWEPLGMTNTFHDICEVQAGNATDRLAQAYTWVKKKETYKPIPMFNQPEGTGAGCIFSCANDYAKWIQTMIKRGGPLSEESHTELRRPRSIPLEDEDDDVPFLSPALYAMGWSTESYRGIPVVAHDGSVPGFSSVMRFLPKQEWGIVVFGNSNHAWKVAEAVFKRLMDDLLRVPVDDRVDWAKYYRDLTKKWAAEAEEEKESNPYKTVPDPKLPLSVPVEALVGKYWHPGYKEITLRVADGKLRTDCFDRCTPFVIGFEHFSGTLFIAELIDLDEDDCKTPETVFEAYSDYARKQKSEFKIDSSGKVESLGIEFGDEKDPMIWFKKLDS